MALTDPEPAETFLDHGARLLAADPGAIERTLERHRRGRGGHCRLCGPGHRWPCAPASIALHAVASGTAGTEELKRATLRS